MKRKIMLLTITSLSLIFSIFIISFVVNKNIKIKASDKLIEYECLYYKVDIPNNWNNTMINNNPLMTNFHISQTHVANIEVNPSWEYNMTIESILSNWMGMHAYVEGDVIEEHLNGYKMIKVYIAYEKPLSDTEASPTELHYFYLKDNNIINLTIDPNYTEEDLADEIAKSIFIKM